MDAWRFILASLRHYRRIHTAVALGVAVATAVLTGALVVGDSMRGSLRELTLQRLGRIDTVLVAGHPFRAALAEELAADAEFKKHFASAEPAFLLSGTLQAGNGKEARRANSISLVGTGAAFWSLGEGGPAKLLADGEVALTEAVARELDVKPGDDIIVRVPKTAALPADSALGKKSETSQIRTMKVGAVLPTEGLARFAVAPSQQLPRTAFMPLSTMQRLLEQPAKANAVLIGTTTDRLAGEEGRRTLERALRPTLDDYGFQLQSVGANSEMCQLSADQLVLPDDAVRAVERA